jgi:hypothetical protein
MGNGEKKEKYEIKERNRKKGEGSGKRAGNK